MALTNFTNVQTLGIGSNIEVVGVITTGQFKSGTSNLHSSGVELTNLNVSGIATIGGNLSIGGTLTYQDVTNIDSVGLITARSGINVSGGQLDVGSNIKIGNAGVITATSFVGSGANLTSLPAANLTGTLPAISGANLTGITQTTINNNADNRLITGSGTANTLEGEANLTFDGTNLDLGDGKYVRLGASNDFQMWHNGGTGNTNIKQVTGHMYFYTGSDLNMLIRDGTSVDLYYANSKKFETTNTGITISGNANFANNNKAIFGTGNDAAIYHDDTDFRIDAQDSGSATRNIYIDAGTVNEGGIFLRSAAGDTMFKALTDANCFLYYDNSLKLRTMTDGIENRGHSYPVSNNTYDLGTTSLRWRNIYTNDLNLSNEGSTNSVDNTWGDFTIQEGESDLFLINNRNGKKYKFNLTEVS